MYKKLKKKTFGRPSKNELSIILNLASYTESEWKDRGQMLEFNKELRRSYSRMYYTANENNLPKYLDVLEKKGIVESKKISFPDDHNNTIRHKWVWRLRKTKSAMSRIYNLACSYIPIENGQIDSEFEDIDRIVREKCINQVIVESSYWKNIPKELKSEWEQDMEEVYRKASCGQIIRLSNDYDHFKRMLKRTTDVLRVYGVDPEKPKTIKEALRKRGYTEV